MRKRDIKPDFYTDGSLGQCSRDARYMFPGLWMLADREGRLKEDAREFRAKFFPYDEDITAEKVTEFLDELAKQEVIVRYRVDGENLIHIPGFKRHQNIHPREVDSVLPPPNACKAKKKVKLTEEEKKPENEKPRISAASRGISRPAAERLARPQGLPSCTSGSSGPSGSSGSSGPSSAARQKAAAGMIPVPSVTAYRLAEDLKAAILTRDPKAQAGSGRDPTQWAADIDLLLADGRTEAEIREVIRWCQQPGCFWGPHVMSGRKLRERFDQLWGVMRNNGNAKTREEMSYEEQVLRARYGDKWEAHR